jgi:MYXO-CTERM domain-containing protein
MDGKGCSVAGRSSAQGGWLLALAALFLRRRAPRR